MPADYDASPTTQDVPANLEEVGSYLTGDLKWLKDARKATHFLRRVWISLDQAQRRAHELQRGIQYLQEQAAKQGTTSNVHPAQVAKFLTPEQIASLADSRSRQLLLDADRMRKEADTTRRAALAEHNRLRYALSTLLEDSRLGHEARELIAHHLREVERLTPGPADPPPEAPADPALPVPPPPPPPPATLPPPPLPPAPSPTAPLAGPGLPPPPPPAWAPPAPPGAPGPTPAGSPGQMPDAEPPSGLAASEAGSREDRPGPRPNPGDLDDLFG